MGDLMGGWSRIRAALKKPAWRWKGFLASACQDTLVLILTMIGSYGLVAHLVSLNLDFTKLAIVTLGLEVFALTLLIWRNQYSTEPRYFGFYDVVNIGLVCLALGTSAGLLSFAVGREDITHYTLFSILFTLVLAGGLIGRRVIERNIAIHRHATKVEKSIRVQRTLVAGAGDTGEAILREVLRSKSKSMDIIGLVDDDPEKQSLRIHGVPVMGTVANIPLLVDRLQIEQILIAMPSAPGESIRRVFDTANQTQVRIRTLPALGSIVGGDNKSLLPQLRTIEIQDLLRREPVQTDLAEVGRYLSGEHVLVTGAGGSIGSELARQIAQMSPASMILVGKGENSIYEIEQELIQTTGIAPYTEIADVRDRQSMELIFAKYRPTVVFHAAAHKHVPLMEKNPREAVLNNIQGTLTTAELSVAFGIKKFILISTDKAVKPSSVMGATKRICEMIVSAFGQSSEVEFAAVRFGNVLGSRGSLIPLLQAQIKRGGPVTITHKDMTRFFMTIPEAAQLVLQAGAIGKRGEVFILDMGAPMKILDLAYELIRMHELVPNEDIAIKFTGMRPGEKMHEELVYDKEDLQPTSHAKIRMVSNLTPVSLSQVKQDIDHLKRLFDDPDRLLQSIQDLAWQKNMPPV